MSFSQEQMSVSFENSNYDVTALLLHVDESGLWISYYLDNKQVVIIKLDEDLNTTVNKLYIYN